MTASLLPLPKFVAFDQNGNPLSGGFVTTLTPGGGPLRDTWQDSGQTIPNSNPIVLNADGAATIYGTGIYQFDTTDALGNIVGAYSGLVSASLQSGIFALITDLRANALIVSAPFEVEVTGYWSVADSGAGEFIFLPDDHTSADDGGLTIVDAAGQRWRRETNGMPINVRWFGAKGDGTTNDTVAIQTAVSTGQSVYIQAGTYLVRDAITCSTPGQLIEGAGRAVSWIIADGTFNMSALGVFVINSGEPGSYLKSFKIRFIQPDTGVRAALVAYPPGVYAVTQPRFMLEEMEITNAMTAVNMAGNSGGAYIKDLQASFYTFGVFIDGCVDTVRIEDMHCAGFEMTANQLLIAQSLGTTCIASGRCDDLKLSGCLFLFYADLNLFAGASGYTFGAAVNCSFDGFNGIQQSSGGRMLVSASYFTATQTNFTAVSLTNGTIYLDNCWFGQANSGVVGFISCLTDTGKSSRLLITNCTFEHNAADVTSVVVAAAGTGQCDALITNCYFNRFPNTNYSQPTITVSTSAGAYLTMMGCRHQQIGTGIGVAVNIEIDNTHRVIGNSALGWSNNFPAAVLAVYQFN